MLRQSVRFQNRVVQLRDERGATAVEYALMVTLIAAVIIVLVATLGTNLKAPFSKVSSSI